MKFSLALCLLLAAGCSAFFSPTDVDFQPFLKLQQKAMRSLIAANSASDDPNLINNCFEQYIEDQRATLNNYNSCYTNCVSTAETDKNTLTAQSNDMRNDLLTRSDGMCSNLHSCDVIKDGLEFFDCYRNESADSYKIMFTLNSDANSQFNTISTKYSIIDSDLKTCVDDARLDYARELEKCDSDFNVCIGGNVGTEEPSVSTEEPTVSTEEPAVSTEEPTVSTEEPAVSTEEPTVSTEEPAVSTEEPTVSTEEPAVSTEEPTVSTEVPAVSTEEPTVSTEEPAVSTEEPTVSTEEPAVSTEEPTVSTEEPAVSTEEPTVSTEVPAVSTEEPTVSTEEPAVSTEEPTVSTEEPAVSTEGPTVSTEEPAVSTEEPTVSTEEPSEPTTEKSPEEDIGKILPQTFQNALNNLRKYF